MVRYRRNMKLRPNGKSAGRLRYDIWRNERTSNLALFYRSFFNLDKKPTTKGPLAKLYGQSWEKPA